MTDLETRDVVTCFLRSDGEILLLKRSEDVGSYAGRWGAVAGHADDDPDAAARREIAEETGIDDAVLVRSGAPFDVEDDKLGIRWIVHPYLFETDRRTPSLNYESTSAEWVSAAEILHRACVPDLWTSYRAVAPTVEGIRRDRSHGSAYLSLRALEVLRDEAAQAAIANADPVAEADTAEDVQTDAIADIQIDSVAGAQSDATTDADWQHLRTLALRLIDARPTMAAVSNRINRAMTRCAAVGASDRVDAVHDVLLEAVDVDRRASDEAVSLIKGRTVLTLSRSGTVLRALLDARPRLLAMTSHPGGEGIAVANQLSEAGLDVSLLPDASVASAPPFDLLLLGCDTLYPDGSVVNKVGSFAAALVATHRSVPVYVLTALDKIRAAGDVDAPQKSAERSRVADAAPEVRVLSDMFERVPSEMIGGYITEIGVLRSEDIARHAEELRALTDWQA